MILRHLRGGVPDVNVEQLVCECTEPPDRDALAAAVAELARRHDALRSRVDFGVEPPVLRVDATASTGVVWTDLSDRSEEDAGRALEEALAEGRRRPFDLGAEPPFRVEAFALPGGRWTGVLTLHHVLADGRSYVTLLTDLFDLYDAGREGAEPDLSPPPPPDPLYGWHRDRDWSEGTAFWRDVLGAVEEPTLLGPATGGAASTSERIETTREVGEELDAGLRRLAEETGATVNAVVQAAWAVLLAKLLGEASVTFGNTRAGRSGTVEGADAMVGTFIATVPVHVDLADRSVASLVGAVRAQHVESRPWEHVPLMDLQELTSIPGRDQAFDTLVIFDRHDLEGAILAARPEWRGRRSFHLRERTPFPVTLYAYASPRLRLKLSVETAAASADEVAGWMDRLLMILRAMAEDPSRPALAIEPLHDDERALLDAVNDTAGEATPASLVEQLAARVEAHPERVAVKAGGVVLTYAELGAEVDRIASSLGEAGIGPGDLVGVALPRSVEMVAVVWGILKAGAAYLPLDPEYPASRLDFCVADARVRAVVTSSETASLFGETPRLDVAELRRTPPGDDAPPAAGPDDLAYVIYTSGSTGRPKGVLVTHGNVLNFLEGMDPVVPHDPPGTWLAVTSLSFDIAVLELLWTLTRGFTVVLHGVAPAAEAAPGGPACSLFFFGSGGDEREEDAYRIVLESARFGDEHGFEAVWTPERHFHAFGGHFPNPSVLGAAIAATTERIHIRAGSVVLPLHSPLRVAEEWAVVDNISRGRVGLSVASGWQPNDFVLAPERYERRRELLFEDIETLRALWAGEAVERTNPRGDRVEVRTHPRPWQDELPIWVTAAGSPDTYTRAGESGTNLLTHLLGQTLDEVREKIGSYREAYRTSGAPGRGRVTLMLHTFVGASREEVRDIVREPLIAYLRSSASLVGHYADAWTAYKRGAGRALDRDAIKELSEEEFDQLLEFAFERYFEGSGLFGTPEECAETLASLGRLGVDEIACLIDFGVATQTVLDHLPYLAEARSAAVRERTVPEVLEAEGVTHMQCTPSAMKMILADVTDGGQMGSLRHLFLGGEALDAATVARVRERCDASVTNMYGPTETTVWSTVAEIGDEPADPLPIGRPILNTRVYVTDPAGHLVPPGTPGELRIGGAGVTRGYLGRPELTGERFAELPGDPSAGRAYRTGDVVRMMPDGTLVFHGRLDDQVKLGGHRIELGEIAGVLQEHPGVSEAVAVVREDGPTGADLVAYVVGRPGSSPDPAALAEFVAERLPPSMLPSVIHPLAALPLTANKKIDRRALPAPWTAPGRTTTEGSVGSSVAGSVQATISGIWQSVLNRTHVDLDASFFDLGGHSLLALEVQRRLEAEFGRRVPVTTLFRHPTVNALASHFAAETDAGSGAASDRAARRRAARGRGRSG